MYSFKTIQITQKLTRKLDVNMVMTIEKVKPSPVSVVDVLPKRRDSKRVLKPLQDLSAVPMARMCALHFMCAYRREMIIADQKADIMS